MKLYKVINRFYDTKDNKKYYEVGDPYPNGDYKPTKERIKELSEVHPVYKVAFIEEIKEEKKTKKTPSKK